jgi:predicted O-linked N-acetylglucosamine transferase (SPINDLY family)
MLSAPGISSGEQRSCSELWIRDRREVSLQARSGLDFRFDARAGRKIRLGYLSSDFQDHATSLLLVEILEQHDRDGFEIHGYSMGADDGKTMRRRLESSFDKFQDISLLSDCEAAQKIHFDGIDILIDLKGYTLGARTGIFLLHPAPIQVNYLGYPGTLGTDICSYIVTDRYVTPPSSASHYSEAFAYMPHSYQPHGRAGVVGAPPARAAVGLPATGFVFCCFNQAYKFTPEIFSLWCRLLSLVPDSVLWLLDAGLAKGNLRNEALRRGINPQRLVFAPDMAQSPHLERLQCADLVLDTSPYGAHTTASDALWVGVPVLTCPGQTFPSRVAGSLLQAVGLDEMIVADHVGYIDLAYELAETPGRMDAVRRKLSRNRLGCKLFDVDGYTADLERLFRIMCARHWAGQPVTAIM